MLLHLPAWPWDSESTCSGGAGLGGAVLSSETWDRSPKGQESPGNCETVSDGSLPRLHPEPPPLSYMDALDPVVFVLVEAGRELGVG